MISIEKTKLDGVLLIKPSIFADYRGKYIETYNKDLYNDNGINIDFIQDDISVSTKYVLRGIHGDNETWKLISCHYGKFYLVVVNNDASSPQYKEWDSFVLTAKDCYQVLVPPKFGNGHLVLSDEAIFHYKQSTYYNPSGQFTIIWNDDKYNISWPVDEPILSQRDKLGHFAD